MRKRDAEQQLQTCSLVRTDLKDSDSFQNHLGGQQQQNKRTSFGTAHSQANMSDGTVQSWPRILLQVEGACIFASTIWAYSRTGHSWWIFVGGILLPDLGMLGYFANTRAGAATYNAVHTETPAIILLCTGFARKDSRITGAALVWLGHIGMDRMIGAGLKYGDRFSHTHLG